VHRLLYYSCCTEHVIAVRWISKGQDGIWCDEQLGPLVHLQKHPVKSLDSSSKCLLLQILSAISLSGLVQHSRSAAKVALSFHLISLFRIPRSGRSHANLVVNKFISTLSIVGISIGKTRSETPPRIDLHSPATFARSDVLSSSPIRMMLPIFFGSILVEVSFLQIRS
jgi:hypothetical protein